MGKRDIFTHYESQASLDCRHSEQPLITNESLAQRKTFRWRVDGKKLSSGKLKNPYKFSRKWQGFWNTGRRFFTAMIATNYKRLTF